MHPRFRVGVIAGVAAVSLLLQPAFSQGRGGAGGGGAAGGGAASGSTGTGPGGTTGTGVGTGTPGTFPSTTTPTTTTNPNSNTTQPTMTQPIFISGRVLLEDGTPPTESVVIERICGTTPRAEGYSDSKGYFSFQLGQETGVMQDASEGGGFGRYGGGSGIPGGGSGMGSRMGSNPETRYMNCDLRARLAGYRSQSVSLANRRPMDNPDIGVILLHRMGANETESTVSSVSLAAPKEAKKAYEKGQDFLKKKKFVEAAKEFQKATEIYPDYAVAWFELGRLQAGGGAPDSAFISFECARKADPKFVPPYVELAAYHMHEKKWKEVVSITDQAAKLDSFDYPELPFYNAVANYNLHNFEVSEKSARQAEHLDTRHRFPQIAFLMGMLLARRQELVPARDELRAYLKMSPDAADAPSAKAALDRIEKITAKAKDDQDHQ